MKNLKLTATSKPNTLRVSSTEAGRFIIEKWLVGSDGPDDSPTETVKFSLPAEQADFDIDPLHYVVIKAA